MDVYPAGAAAVQTVGANQFNDFFVSDDRRTVEAGLPPDPKARSGERHKATGV
jgi:hypothetical protein